MSDLGIVDDGASTEFPRVADTSDMERLFRRGRVGCCRTRMHKEIYFEVDACHPGGMKLPRVRRYFSSASAAVRWAWHVTAEIREHGSLAKALTTGQRWVSTECFQILEALGLCSPAALLNIVHEYRDHHPHGPNARTLDQVRVELIASKRDSGRSDRHVDSLDYRLRSLVTAIGNKPVPLITTKDLQGELARHRNWCPTTVHSVVQGWKIAFNFAVDHGYLIKNPADRLELPRIIRNPPCVFELAQVRALMAATLFRDSDQRLPGCRAYLAIGLFAGLRPEEIERLDWRSVSLDTLTIRVLAADAKDRELRFVDIAPNLAAWLRPIVRTHGPVLPCGLAAARAACREVLGLKAWPQDVMRHTFASNHFAMHRDEAETKHQIGHRDDGRVFYNHYCKPLPQWEAKRFWAIMPPLGCLPCYEEEFATSAAPRAALALAA